MINSQIHHLDFHLLVKNLSTHITSQQIHL